MVSADFAIDLTAVSKVYKRRVHALRGIDMQVRRGDCFGLLGPNGAGKSTLVKIMMSVVRPTHAVGSVLGHPVGSRASLRGIGYLPEHHRFPRYLTGRQVLHFFAALAGYPAGQPRNTRVESLLELVGMRDRAGDKVGQYSKGMMQRIGIAQALAAGPDLIVLDEPTDGVDPVGRRDIRDVLARLKESGTTVFLNSHLLSELEMICDRVAILVGGQVARQGTLDELSAGRAFYEIELAPIAGAPPALPGTPIPGLAPNAPVTRDGNLLRVDRVEPADIQPILDSLRAAGQIIRRIQPVRPSLEDFFMEAVRNQSTPPSL